MILVLYVKHGVHLKIFWRKLDIMDQFLNDFYEKKS